MGTVITIKTLEKSQGLQHCSLVWAMSMNLVYYVCTLILECDRVRLNGLSWKWHLISSLFSESWKAYTMTSKENETLLNTTSLQKHAYTNIQKVSPPKTYFFFFSDKKKLCYIFYISAQNIDCGYSLEPPRRGGSNEYPQCMSLSRNKKNNVYPCKPKLACVRKYLQ